LSEAFFKEDPSISLAFYPVLRTALFTVKACSQRSTKEGRSLSFSSRPALIWGPPATGKTTTIAVAIEAHLNVGRRVLFGKDAILSRVTEIRRQ